MEFVQTNERLKARRENVFRSMQEDALLILYSGKAIPRSLDACYPFSANSHFFYLTGLRRENMALVLRTTQGKQREVLLIEEALPREERWTGRRMRKEEAQEISGIQDVRYFSELDAILSRCCVREGVIAVYFDCYRDAAGDAESYNLAAARRFHDRYPAILLKDAHPLISRLRMCKDEDEIAEIRKAISHTKRGLDRVLAGLRPGGKERDAQLMFEYAALMDGAEAIAFPTIAGAGENACMLHYEENSGYLGDGDLLLLDLGARSCGYCADISRTYPVNGCYSSRQRVFYDLVLKANREIAAFAAPGKTLKELNERCKQVLAEGLIQLGKIEKAEDVSTYYMHNVSHHLGIDTHDAAVDETLPLQPGMVITDEPGLYIDEEGIGIRIEDDLLITQGGCVVLSEEIPRDPETIEALMAGVTEK